MDSWRDTILREFTPNVARLTLVADPDGLLLEEEVLQGIAERGFELIPFEDHVAFRYAYESRYRAHWDRGEATDLVVVLHAARSDLRTLPHDLPRAGRTLAFSLGDLFPNLSHPVIATLDRSHLQVLFEAQQRMKPGPLGTNATQDFVLRHVFGVAPELVKKASDLLRLLLRRHHRGIKIPPALDERLVLLLRQSGDFTGWPLEDIVPDRSAFLAFLQERWPLFLDHWTGAGQEVRDPASSGTLRYPGPPDIPFDHDDVRVFVDNLFLEGLLEPVEHPRAAAVAQGWVRVGVRIAPETDLREQWHGLLRSLADEVPAANATHDDWLVFAPRWGQLNLLRHAAEGPLPEGDVQAYLELQARVDHGFQEWLSARFHTLHNQPATPPTMGHHVPRAMARHLEESPGSKAALVLMDGLAWDQWLVVRDVVRSQRPGWRMDEGAVFAWIPTLTMVSRQACFAGRPPLYFPATIHTTDKEPVLWQRFWEDTGLTGGQVGYEKNVRGPGDLERVKDTISHPHARAVGIVVDSVDRIMHGMELGTAGMHNQVRQWAKEGTLVALVDMLLEADYGIFLVADHGNTEAVGWGRPAEGVIADLRSVRARIFPDAGLRASVHQRFPEAIAWPPVGLPTDYLPLLASGRAAFVKEGERLVSHGGITVEEVIVPYVRIEGGGP